MVVFPPSLLPFLNNFILLILLFHQTAFLRDSFQSVRLFPMMHLFWPKSMPGPNQDEEVWEGVVEKTFEETFMQNLMFPH